MSNTDKQKFKQVPRETTRKNYHQKAILSDRQKEIIKQEFSKIWKTCEHEMLEREGLNTITPSRKPLSVVLEEILKKTGILAELKNNYDKNDINNFLKELKLKCPTCGKKLTANIIVGKYLGDDEFWHSFTHLIESSQSSLKNITSKSRPRNRKIASSIPKYQSKRQQNFNQTNNRVKVFLLAVEREDSIKQPVDEFNSNQTFVSFLKQIASQTSFVLNR